MIDGSLIAPFALQASPIGELYAPDGTRLPIKHSKSFAEMTYILAQTAMFDELQNGTVAI